MNKSIFVYLFSFGLATFLLFPSCKRCNTCDQSFINNGASLQGPDSVNKLEPAVLSIIPLIDVQKGDCPRRKSQTSTICGNDMKVSVTCSRELRLKQREIPAGENLMSDSTITDTRTYNNPYPDLIPNTRELQLKPGPSFQAGIYMFYLEGTSGHGALIRDTVRVTWVQP